VTRSQTYDAAFFDAVHSTASRSAAVVAPLVADLVEPTSVVDVGCGLGAWLARFSELGIDDVLGLDGDHVERERLVIPEDRFRAVDLGLPFELERRFDLVVSLEVAEHLPPDRAAGFVDSLTALGPIVLFSAAIPGQGGTGHVNEQWPTYWARLFSERGFALVDALRAQLWENKEVAWWYSQNIVLYVREPELRRRPRLKRETAQPLRLVHPALHELRTEELRWERNTAAARRRLEQVVPPRAAFLLVDEGAVGDDVVPPGRRALPFLEREGVYWGFPPDDETAIRELERARSGGAAFLVLLWPALWVLDHYTGFSEHVRARFARILDDEAMVVFDLRTPP
jgi:SAM-dependent methyltransferase